MGVELEKEHVSTMETKDPSNLSPNGDETFYDDVYLKGEENTEGLYLGLPPSSQDYFSDLYEEMDQGSENLNFYVKRKCRWYVFLNEIDKKIPDFRQYSCW